MSKHTTLDQLKMLAQRTKGEIDKVDSKVATLSGRVDTLEGAGGQANVLEGVKVNGTALKIVDKVVDTIHRQRHSGGEWYRRVCQGSGCPGLQGPGV